MLLEHPDLPAFESQPRRITDTAFTDGLAVVARTERSVKDIKDDFATDRRLPGLLHDRNILSRSSQ